MVVVLLEGTEGSARKLAQVRHLLHPGVVALTLLLLEVSSNDGSLADRERLLRADASDLQIEPIVGRLRRQQWQWLLRRNGLCDRRTSLHHLNVGVFVGIRLVNGLHAPRLTARQRRHVSALRELDLEKTLGARTAETGRVREEHGRGARGALLLELPSQVLDGLLANALDVLFAAEAQVRPPADAQRAADADERAAADAEVLGGLLGREREEGSEEVEGERLDAVARVHAHHVGCVDGGERVRRGGGMWRWWRRRILVVVGVVGHGRCRRQRRTHLVGCLLGGVKRDSSCSSRGRYKFSVASESEGEVVEERRGWSESSWRMTD